MIEETFTDDERQLLLVLTTKALVDTRADPEFRAAAAELSRIVAKLAGVDTVLVARRAYPS